MSEPKHIVAIIGGAVAGSEAARIFAERGVISVVIEQNPRPFGKIEDGLPRWHLKQRRKEYEKITEKLSAPNVHFVPRTVLGRDIPFQDLLGEWGFSAVLLANGAWRDRPLQIEGVDAYVDKGLVYQNPFVYWFNHFVEKSYDGPQYPIHDGVCVVGGGLASIDVVKILQIELVRRHLSEKRGIEVDMHDLEKRGIPKVLAEHGLKYEDLGLEGCSLYYRRRVLDMPLAEYPDNADEGQKEKTHQVRAKILANAQEKFLFKFVDRHLPIGSVVEGDRLVGLRFIRTEIEGKKVVNQPGTEYDIRFPMVISSIGSIPMPISGLAMRGETYEVEDWDTGKIKGYDHLWGLGNVVTGKGNIRASLKHSAFVAGHVARTYLGLDGDAIDIDLYAGQEQAVADAAGKIAQHIQKKDPVPAARVQAILDRVKKRQTEVGHTGTLQDWLAKVTPPDME